LLKTKSNWKILRDGCRGKNGAVLGQRETKKEALGAQIKKSEQR
jgi:hypothetical protein